MNVIFGTTSFTSSTLMVVVTSEPNVVLPTTARITSLYVACVSRSRVFATRTCPFCAILKALFTLPPTIEYLIGLGPLAVTVNTRVSFAASSAISLE